MLKLVTKLYNKRISGIGLSIFRIAYCLVLLCEIAQFYYFRHLIFDKVPFLDPAEINFAIPIAIWGISVFFVLIGLFTRTATLINYLLGLILIGSIKTFEYHMFYPFMSINLLLLFLPISKNLSLDRLFLRYKYSNTRFNYTPPKDVSVLAYFVPLLVGLGFVYFDSIFFKYTSHFWTNGLGVWLPTSVPVNIYIPLNGILNQEYIMYFLGYLTLIFETIFIFTFFRKKWRIPLVIIGIGLHIGILICYPIPWFALGMCALYLLLIPVSFWLNISKKLELKNPTMTFYYDAECPLCNRTKITIQSLDFQKSIVFKTVQFDSQDQPLLKNIPFDHLLDNIYSVKNGKVYEGIDTYIQVFSSIIYLKPISWLIRIPGIYHIGKSVYKYIATNRDTERCTEDNCGYTPPTLPVNDDKLKLLQSFTLKDLKINLVTIGIIILIVSQSIVTYNSPLNKMIREKIGFQKTGMNANIEELSSNIGASTKVLFGITYHGVFMDYHFSEYNHNIAVIYLDKSQKETWLPITDYNGTTGDYLIGPIWAKWGFRINHNKINQQDLEKGIRDFTAFWAKKNNVNLNDATFIIKVKKIDTPTKWEKDFLQKQIDKPWQNVGKATWQDQQYTVTIPTIENL